MAAYRRLGRKQNMDTLLLFPKFGKLLYQTRSKLGGWLGQEIRAGSRPETHTKVKDCFEFLIIHHHSYQDDNTTAHWSEVHYRYM